MALRSHLGLRPKTPREGLGAKPPFAGNEAPQSGRILPQLDRNVLTGEIIDKDLLILADKMRKLTPSQIRIVENVIDECCALFGTQP